MKYLSYLLFIFLLPATCGDKKNTENNNRDTKLLINHWVEGIQNEAGEVLPAPVSRAGWYRLIIQEDQSVKLMNPPHCGFNFYREGTWDASKKEITFHFTKKTGYGNNPTNENINETERYSIELNTEESLILKSKEEGNQEEEDKVFVFIKDKN